MKIRNRLLVLVYLVASLAAFAQAPANAPQQTHPEAAPAAPASQAAQPAAKLPSAAATPAASAKEPDRASAYYHFQLGHIYEEMVATSGRAEFASQAVEEYKAALQADPASPYLASALAELYARTGDIREAVVEAQDVLSRDPDNLDARRLLGRIYLRSVGDCRAAQRVPRKETPKPFSTLPSSNTSRLCV